MCVVHGRGEKPRTTATWIYSQLNSELTASQPRFVRASDLCSRGGWKYICPRPRSLDRKEKHRWCLLFPPKRHICFCHDSWRLEPPNQAAISEASTNRAEWFLEGNKTFQAIRLQFLNVWLAYWLMTITIFKNFIFWHSLGRIGVNR